MKFTLVSMLTVVGLAAAAPAPVAEPNVTRCKIVVKTSTVTTTSSCPLVSLPLSPIVTGTLVPVGSITSALLGVLARAPEPTAAPQIEARNDCYTTSTTTVTTTVKPTCGIVNP